MTKKISKLLLALALIFVTLSSFSICFAEVNGETTKAVTTAETTEENTQTDAIITEEKTHKGDLYLFDNNVVMDKLVYGNVFIFGDNVQITGQIDGNLFVFADTLTIGPTFEESNSGVDSKCQVTSSIFACANSIYYNGACNYLYVATSKLDMTYNSFVVRDVKAVSSNAIIKAAIGRDIDLVCDTVDFGQEKDIPAIYGNLRYIADTEVEIPEGVISGDGTITYTKPTEVNINYSTSLIDILTGFATCIITALIIYLITKKSTPSFNEKLSNTPMCITNLLKAFGTGIVSFIAVLFVSILLLITIVGAKLSVILVLLYVTLCLISIPILTIAITNSLKTVLKLEKTSMFCLILVIVSVVLYGITLIPFIGGLLGIIIKITAIGLLISIFLPHKKLTDEEKAAIEEAKKQRKLEKAEAKAAKKQAKEEKQNTDL